MRYIPVIGLEVHAELKTKSKMFCLCENNPDEKRPNKNTCPICLAHPGTLPTINKQAVDAVICFGLAIGGKIAKESNFDRKSYFYPDLPKGYQISQYDHPFVFGGVLADISVKRVHLEEDTGKLLHDIPGVSTKKPTTFVDFNRAGVPLMELVTEPSVETADQALTFARELQRVLRYLGISDADMEKGQMRIEVNISLRPENIKEFGTKVEVKNINSFKAVAGAIDYEIDRQTKILDRGEKVIQETRGWDDTKNITVSQRSKESAHDYRYFPEPDLPPLTFSDEYINVLKQSLPELPGAKKERFMKEYGLTLMQAEELIDDISFANYFEESVSELLEKTDEPNIILLFNYLSSDMKGILKAERKGISDMKIPPEHFAHLITLIQGGKISSRMAKDLLLKMHDSGEDPETIISSEGMEFMDDDDALLTIIHDIIKKNEKAVSDYKKGKPTAIQFLVGQAMGKTKGQGNPEKLRTLFEKHLNS